MEVVSDRQKIAGIISRRGFRYQDIAIAHKIVVWNWDEVYCEEDGADYTRKFYHKENDITSKYFIQCKTKGTGQYTLSAYIKDVIPTFVKIYNEYQDKSMPLSFILETNVVLQRKLKNFSLDCRRYAQNVLPSPNVILLRIGRSMGHKLKRHFVKDMFLFRFLRGLAFYEQHTQEHMALEVLLKFKDIFGNYNAMQKFEQLLGVIYQIDQELITKNQLEEKLSAKFSQRCGEDAAISLILQANDLLKQSSVSAIDDKAQREFLHMLLRENLEKNIIKLEEIKVNIKNHIFQEKLITDINQANEDLLAFSKTSTEILDYVDSIERNESHNQLILRRDEVRRRFWDRYDEEH